MHSAVPPAHASENGAEERLTPVLLTALLTGLALMPVAWQQYQPGRGIDGPMVAVILGAGLLDGRVPVAGATGRDSLAAIGAPVTGVQTRGTLADNSPGGLDREEKRERQ